MLKIAEKHQRWWRAGKLQMEGWIVPQLHALHQLLSLYPSGQLVGDEHSWKNVMNRSRLHNG
jgi:hypothetical protein